MDIIVPRGINVMRGSKLVTAGKNYKVHVHHITNPDGVGWQGEIMWSVGESVVVWIGSGNLWNQARISDVIVQEETLSDTTTD